MCHLPLGSNQEQQKCCIGRKGRISSVSTFESRCDKSRPHLKKESKTDLAPIQKLIYCDCSWPNVKICFYFSSSTFKEVSKKKFLQLVKDYVRKLKHHFSFLIDLWQIHFGRSRSVKTPRKKINLDVGCSSVCCECFITIG